MNARTLALHFLHGFVNAWEQLPADKRQQYTAIGQELAFLALKHGVRSALADAQDDAGSGLNAFATAFEDSLQRQQQASQAASSRPQASSTPPAPATPPSAPTQPSTGARQG